MKLFPNPHPLHTSVLITPPLSAFQRLLTPWGVSMPVDLQTVDLILTDHVVVKVTVVGVVIVIIVVVVVVVDPPF